MEVFHYAKALAVLYHRSAAADTCLFPSVKPCVFIFIELINRRNPFSTDDLVVVGSEMKLE